MSWEKVKLGDVTDSCLGKMLDKNKNKGDYQPYLANINVRWGSFDLENLSKMRFQKDEEKRYGLEYGDLIICEGGEPGRCAIWKNQITNMKIQKALHRVRVGKELDYRYLYYWFLLAGKQNALKQYFTGATIMHLPGDKLKSIVIEKPAFEKQVRIADILSSYDDLIENNQKQIKLLEEAAQRLYKEWFVDFRFPGHENTTFIDGLPEGWEYLPIKDAFSWIRGKSYTSLELSDTEGVKLVNLKNIKAFGGYNRGAEKRFTGSFKQEQLLQPGDVVMGVTDMTKERRLVGHVAIIPDLKEKMNFSMDLIKLLPNRISKCYLYSLMFFGGYSKKISPLANGTNVLHLKPEAMNTMSILIPNKVIMTQYDDLFTYYNRKIEMLEDQIEVLKEARDRLLPKLMSGEIEV